METPSAKPSLPLNGAPPHPHQSGTWPLTIAYLAFIIYGSLYPLSGWEWTRGGWHVLLHSFDLRHLSRSDVAINLLVYIPLGFLLYRSWHHRFKNAPRVVIATLIGVLISLILEYAQSYLPSRVSSLSDLALNSMGSFAGAMLAYHLAGHSITGLYLARIRHHYLLPGKIVNLGITVIALWFFSQLLPLVPSLDRGTLVQGLAPLLQSLRGLQAIDPGHALNYALNICALGLISHFLVRIEHRFIPLFGAAIGTTLLMKITVVGRQLSMEALLGAGIALVLLAGLIRLPKIARFALAIAMVLLAYCLAQLHGVANPHAPLLVMNWIPFRGQLEGRAGLEDIAGTLWPFAALAYIVLIQYPHRPRIAAVLGAVLIFAFAFGLEWAQTHIPGRYPDITDAGLAVLGWCLPWFYSFKHSLSKTATASIDPVPPIRNASIFFVALLIAGVIIFTVLTYVLSSPTIPLDESRLQQLPAANDLAPVSLAHFHDAHPRLPSPSAEDIARLRKDNPTYWAKVTRRARQGNGDLYSITLLAYADPAGQDLDSLYRRLMGLRFFWRGHEQTKPLAVAYDWLYDRWSPKQRMHLRDKLAEGCNYEINFIREKRLSPYNVFLYNSPFQALMACAIALYHDDPRGNPVMAFTSDYWKNRVLPVWRQIMGKNGGWHEGNEYVGIGIGQAIYELPAMWRKATGEDYFKSEPGIRGFLKFIIYRTRPDGTNFRWGDGRFFQRTIPDLLPLAMEYRDTAAYSLHLPPPLPEPSSWPWGPLTDNALYDHTAISRLPLTYNFDGLGLIVARSDWTPDATYVTFHAGDNYWSHSHLDQGAFTIYKGGALAIDSGLYGPYYSSDHHMDYEYQAIAHNTITVTDPEDTLPDPPHGNRPSRPIANDGGQRRIGSGWGVEAAPLDLAEWQRKRETYHTGTMEQLLIKDGLTIAVADLTPAYTNANSGHGTFTDRTRRVEDFHRIFAYDRDDDVILVFDRVVATQPSFHKRWLLHTLEKPLTTPDGFVVNTLPTGEIGHAGGHLEGHVLLPHNATLKLVGGPGREYFVDGKNYDDGVAAILQRRKGAEPGKWRIEISPPTDEKQDHFLVVMVPSLNNEKAPHSIRLLKDSPTGTIGVEVRGPHHVGRWYFDDSARSLRVEITDKEGSHSYALQGSHSPAQGNSPSLLNRVRALFN